MIGGGVELLALAAPLQPVHACLKQPFAATICLDLMGAR
jgi:hypothetical protein